MSGWRWAASARDIAAEAGSIVLMGDPLEPLPGAIRLARQTVRIIRQNILVFAFGLNGLAVLLAGLRVLGPVAAAIFHQIGSLLVLLNAMRLLGFERWGELPGVRTAGRAIAVCRTCRPSSAVDWAWRHRRAVAPRNRGPAAAGLPRLGDRRDRPRPGRVCSSDGAATGRRCSGPGCTSAGRRRARR